ncbi:uncharacterized protein BDZ99DRAFT_555404 [Mytilinidion resinicola]|uniref:Uncharacterized protein n=1 Tax=Mytilinidion resinicola TaxID=574789 RepID=A0A6A6XZD9_9PEZI|nr:uncharacterized protein BDZ99DRAFT_555404 [Mytilinidion resinicola]KAF2801345.1 hypothetical protein BDZ99DRAFT_555404 [Mytilinidion resinicola]
MHIAKERRVQSEKFAPRAHRGKLIGFDGDSIYFMRLDNSTVVRSASVEFVKLGVEVLPPLNSIMEPTPDATEPVSDDDSGGAEMPTVQAPIARAVDSGGAAASPYAPPIPVTEPEASDTEPEEDEIVLPQLGGTGHNPTEIKEDDIQAELRAQIQPAIETQPTQESQPTERPTATIKQKRDIDDTALKHGAIAADVNQAY